MLRWTFRILICLVLGAVTTVGVAWGLALWTDVSRSLWTAEIIRSPPATDRQRLTFLRHGALRKIILEPDVIEGVINLLNTRINSTVPAAQRTIPYPRLDPVVSSPLLTGVLDARGWPFLAMRGRFEINSPDGTGPIEQIYSAILIGQHANAGTTDKTMTRLIPLAPVWPGFLIDTFFYGALWFGLFFGFGAARRGLRTKRGLCPICAYDLRGNLDAGCPECGWNRSDNQPPGEAGG